jgi:hypothetical protein
MVRTVEFIPTYTGYLIIALGLAASFTYGVLLGVSVINPYCY